MTQPTQSARVRPQPVFRTLAAALLVLLLASCAWRGGPADGATAAEAGLPPLETLMGEWYVAARVPWFGERGRVAASYRFSAEDADARRIGIERTWRDGFDEPLQSDHSTARRDGAGNRIWKMRAWKVFPARLRVLEAATDGSWLLLDTADRDHAWILTRARVVEDDAYLELERRIGAHGVNTDKLRRVAQVPGQEGRLGFEPAARPSPSP